MTEEAEWSNHDPLTAVPTDYEKMAAHDPEEAIWLVKNCGASHYVLEELNNPDVDKQHVENNYSRNIPL